MKVLQFHYLYRPFGGGEQYFSTLCNSLEDRGHSVVVITSPHPDNYSHPDNRKVYFIDGSFGPKSGYRMWKKVKAIIDLEDPDIIHFHETLGFVSPLIIKRLTRLKPTIQTLHTAFFFAPQAQNFCLTRNCAATQWGACVVSIGA